MFKMHNIVTNVYIGKGCRAGKTQNILGLLREQFDQKTFSHYIFVSAVKHLNNVLALNKSLQDVFCFSDPIAT